MAWLAKAHQKNNTYVQTYIHRQSKRAVSQTPPVTFVLSKCPLLLLMLAEFFCFVCFICRDAGPNRAAQRTLSRQPYTYSRTLTLYTNLYAHAQRQLTLLSNYKASYIYFVETTT